MKKSLRHIIDLNPSAGDSFMGLTREQAKYFAMFFIIIGGILADPPGGFIPLTDFLNFWLATLMLKYLGINFNISLLITYTILAWSIIGFGLWAYPYNTYSLFNGYIN